MMREDVAMNWTICERNKELGLGEYMASRMPRLLGGLSLSLGLALLGGCASTSGTSEGVERHAAASVRQPVSSGHYRVQRGDTLYSIAFRYGWDWKELAAHNRIAAPYTIRVGQVIRFGHGGAAPRTLTTARPVVAPAAPRVPVVSTPVVPSTVRQTSPSPALPASAGGWTWPADGELIALFSSNSSLNKGVDIAGNLGQPVMAASAGNVVYAGSGLRGYGELIIIKHNDTYVSAYGHNRRLLVREGQQVKAGDKIAEMGATGTDRVKLHFEIRRQGKPVDPLQYLPRR